ncbi:hypothetical protein [Halpernia frigidisoli]|uniref:Secreted protein n=1 Tax=Halpernia frigidisoli TaxID=1125876 RepID=A0A1I3GHH2_9FLAO|nr:hypothetical protein [Halpernia frigidisoli]SFI22601.1 hypothetical protein SAMN05443292_1834 [Halpernia frigidisoli]
MYKKILFCSLLMVGSLAFAQQNQSYNGWGDSNNSYNNSNNYGNSYDDYDNDYPDDYYYDYPSDYYPQSYYESYYNDYRKSIVSINWPQIFRQYRLNRNQINQIIYINNRYQNFNTWNAYYGVNPDRWYYERFNALKFILGPTIFINFQNHYYHGYNPVVYFQNYRRTYYVPRYHVRTQYRNVNIVKYRVDRDTYRDNRAGNGLYDPNYRNNLSQNKSSESSGFRNGIKTENSPFLRDNTVSPEVRSGGLRSGSSAENNTPQRNEVTSPNNIGGFRNGRNSGENGERQVQSQRNQRNDSGFRTESGSRKSSENTTQRSGGEKRSEGIRGGGLR